MSRPDILENERPGTAPIRRRSTDPQTLVKMWFASPKMPHGVLDNTEFGIKQRPPKRQLPREREGNERVVKSAVRIERARDGARVGPL